MRNSALLAVGALTVMLAACGGSAEEPVVEQIVVREPGEAAPVAAEMVDASVDLVAAGEAAFAMCSSCHVAYPDEPSAAGPNLHGVVGREAGSLDDFAYSEALDASDMVWDAATLDGYLADPAATVPGTIMISGAVEDPDRRAAIIAYLESLSE